MSNKDFVWTDELVVKFTTWSLTQSPTFQGRYADIEQFKSEHPQTPPFDHHAHSQQVYTEPRPLKELQKEEKEWEIVAVYDGCINGHKDGRCIWETKDKLSQEKALQLGFTIHSVRRLSDGDVFTVGDRYSNNHCGIYTEHKIKDFVVSGNELQVWPEDGGYYPLFSIKKIPTKTPLFTTEDGKPVYEGDECWFVSERAWLWTKVQAPKYPFYGANNEFKYFSTEDAAREWVLMNKPCLSVKDFIDKFTPTPWTETQIKELAKSKINNQ